MTENKALILVIFIAVLAAGIFLFWKEKKPQLQTQIAINLKLLNSHSAPQTGEDWVVSFETEGKADLTITPQGQDTVGDLDFVSLTCDGTEETAVQNLSGDVIFCPVWQCTGTAELTHLVNTARKHSLSFHFGDQLAFAYNNPDSVTDTFTDESKIAATSSMVAIGGQVKLAEVALKGNGESCSSGGECESNNCVDGYCCNTACGGACDRCNVGGSEGTCTDVNSDCAGTGASCYCSGGNCQACSNNDSSCNCSGYTCQACATCKTCSSYSCANRAIDTQPTGCTGCNYCNGSGTCLSCTLTQSSASSNYYPSGSQVKCTPSRSGTTLYSSGGSTCGSTVYTGQTYEKYTGVVRYTCTCSSP